ncbi:MAG: metal ABC transporter ATP-binding protein [Thermoflexales bacterium]|nr:metal ABC transporter ATP-binding protein [Thermoflexales bacterium]
MAASAEARTEKHRQEVISIRNLWASYDHEPVLEDVNLSVKERDFIGLIGPNGGGKTTLIKVLLGLLPPQQGEVHILGRQVAEGRRYIGYVPQWVEFDREFPISVWDVARMGRLGSRRLLQRFTARDDEMVEKALCQVDMLHLRKRPIGDLSGGQRQRVYIARALAVDPAILLLDEPTASVDPQASASIYEIIRRLNERVTILLVSHDMNTISSHVKTVGCLNRRLFYHGEKQVTPEMLEAAYQCPVDLIAHGVPHRVFAEHTHTPPGGD